MLENGFIKLYRSLLKWEWYDDINTKTVFLHLLLTVSIEDSKWHGIEVKRGSRVSSYAKLAEETKLTVKQVRTAISHLESTGEVARYKHPKFTVFAIKNYDLYQCAASTTASKWQGEGKVGASKGQQYKKVQEDKESKECSCTVPTQAEVRDYAMKIDAATDPDKFFRHFEKCNWEIGGSPVRDWKAVFRAWNKKDSARSSSRKNIPKSDNAEAYKGFIYNMEDEVST